MIIIRVQKKDERSFPQKQNLIKVKLNSPTKQKTIHKGNHQLSQTSKNTNDLNIWAHLLSLLSTPFWIINQSQLSYKTLSGTPLKVIVQEAYSEE